MSTTIKRIANWFYHADHWCRTDLIQRHIVDEREYMARWITYMDRSSGRLGRKRIGYESYFVSRTLSPHLERSLGCDALFSFRYKNQIKILCIESKRPDFRGRDDWDNIDMTKSTPASRFTKQIRKQQVLANQGVLVYEMFLNDEQRLQTRPGYDKLGSSFVRRGIALDHGQINIDPNPRAWKWEDADTIVRKQSIESPVDIKYLVEMILSCQIGNRLNLDSFDGDSQFVFEDGGNTFNLPVPDLKTILENQSFGQKIERFIEQTGISQIGFFQTESETFWKSDNSSPII